MPEINTIRDALGVHILELKEKSTIWVRQTLLILNQFLDRLIHISQKMGCQLPLPMYPPEDNGGDYLGSQKIKISKFAFSLTGDYREKLHIFYT